MTNFGMVTSHHHPRKPGMRHNVHLLLFNCQEGLQGNWVGQGKESWEKHKKVEMEVLLS